MPISAPENLKAAFARLRTKEGSILDLMAELGLNPEVDLRGGDWRNCSFVGLDLRGFNFAGARLVGADFSRSMVAMADFRGAQAMNAKLHLANDWPEAVLDDIQRQYLSSQSPLKHVEIPLLITKESSGHPLSVWEYVALIKSKSNYIDAKNVYDRMIDRGIIPNKHVFATLIDKSKDFDIGIDLLKEARMASVGIDEAVLNAVMSNARSFEEAWETFKIYEHQSSVKTNYPYNILISKSSNFDQAVGVLATMRDHWKLPDRVTINAVLNVPWSSRDKHFEESYDLVRRSIQDGIALSHADIAALIRRADSDEDVARGMTLLEMARLKSTIQIEDAIIAVSSSFSEALLRYENMLSRKVRPDKHTFYALLKACDDHQQAFEVLARMRQAGLPFDRKILDRFIAKCPDPSRSRLLRQQIESSGNNSPEAVVRGLVIRWAEDDERRDWLDRIFPL